MNRRFEVGENAYLMSKIVFLGFIAAWFFAASPIKRSSSVKDTNEGVVKLPCSLATRTWKVSNRPNLHHGIPLS